MTNTTLALQGLNLRASRIRQVVENTLSGYCLTDDQITHLVGSLMSDRSSAVNVDEQNSVSQQFDRLQASMRSRTRFHLNYDLCEEDRAKLAELFPSFAISYRAGSAPMHALASAARQLAQEQLLRTAGRRNKLLGLGMNYASPSVNFHVCCDIHKEKGSTRETLRCIEREKNLTMQLRDMIGSNRVDTMTEKKKKKYEKLKKFSDATFPFHCLDAREDLAKDVRCFHGAENCDVEADTILAVHSTYDMSKEELVSIMCKKKAKRMLGTVMWDPIVQQEFEGRFPLLNVNYSINLEKRQIEFTFDNDHSFIYPHDIEDYMRLGIKEAIYCDGTLFVYDIYDSSPGLIYFSLVRVDYSRHLPPPNVNYFADARTSAVILHTYALVENKGLDDPAAFRPVTATLPAYLFDDLVSKFSKNTEFTREDVFNVLRTRNGSFVINGQRLRSPEDRIGLEDIYAIVNVVLVAAFRQTYLLNQLVNVTLDQISARRALISGSMKYVLSAKLALKNFMHAITSSWETNIESLHSVLMQNAANTSVLMDITSRFTYTRVVAPHGVTSTTFSDVIDKTEWEQQQARLRRSVVPDNELQVDSGINTMQAFRAMLIDLDCQKYAEAIDTLNELLNNSFEDQTFSDDMSEAVVHKPMVPILSDYGIKCDDESDDREVDCDEPIAIVGRTMSSEEKKLLKDIKKVRYKIPCEGKISKEDFLPDAVKVIHAYWQYSLYSHKAILSDADYVRQQCFTPRGYAMDFIRNCQHERYSPNFIEFDRSGRFLKSILPLQQQYCVGLSDSGNVIPIVYRPGAGGAPEPMNLSCVERLFVYEPFIVFNYEKLAAVAKKALELPIHSGFEPPDVHLHAGVPGCGKTTAIIDKIKSLDHKDFLMVSACRSAADDVRRKVVDMGILDKVQASKKIRTIHSYLLHGGMPCKVLYVDELYMAHPGEIYMLLLFIMLGNRGRVPIVTTDNLTKTDNTDDDGLFVAHFFGDDKQIPFINRLSGILPDQTARFQYFTTYSFNSLTRRCPEDVSALLPKFYDNVEVQSTSEVRNSLSYTRIGSLAAVAKDRDCVYLVYFQEEAQRLRNLGYGDKDRVMTVHEAQGKTFDEVRFIRTKPIDHSLFSSEAHNLVALTRHRQKFTYMTVMLNDPLCKCIDKAIALSSFYKGSLY